MTAPKRLWFLALLSLIGVVVSVMLSQHFYDLRSGTSGFKSFCNINSTVNCDVVAASSYSQLLPGFPLSSFSAGWFVALFVIALLARNPFWRREALRASFLMNAFGATMSIIYLVIMATVIQSYCINCLVVDAVSLLSFILVLSLKPENLKTHKPDPGKWKTFGWITAASLFVAVLGLKSLDASPSLSDSTTQEMVNNVLQSPAVSVGSGEQFPSMGPANAPVTIVEFSDFQCPFCRMGATVLKTVMYRNPGKVRVVFRNFPLDGACNRLVQHTVHQVACEAAKVAICAHMHGKFEPIYEKIFEEQKSLAPSKPVEYAVAAGLNADQLKSCLNSNEVTLALSKDVEEGASLGIKSTPTIFINGHRMEGVSPLPVFDAIIEKLTHGTH